MSEITSELIAETAQNLENLRSQSDAIRVPAERWILNFREQNSELFMFILIRIISANDVHEYSKAMSAILLYSIFHKRTYDQQREFNNYWSQLDADTRRELAVGATSGIYSDNFEFLVQYANLLGAFYAIEFPLDTFEAEIASLLEQTALTAPPNERLAAFQVFLSFTHVCLDFCSTCGKDQMFHQFSPILFQNILLQMNDASNDTLQHLAAKILAENLSFFFRPVSFPAPFEALMEAIFSFIQLDNKMLFQDGFNILCKVIDYFYNLIGSYGDPLVEMLAQNLQSENIDRIIQSCLVLHLIGEVESDITEEDKSLMKMRHRDFDQNFGFSIFAFEHLLETLIQLIMAIEETDTFEHSPQLAAFICLADLAKAVDQEQKEKVVDFINTNMNAEEWQLRFASVLMTAVALQIPCFVSQPQNVLGALSSFINMMNDTNPLVLDATLWCLGKCVSSFSDLAMNAERFNTTCQRLPELVLINQTLADRCCWLLKQCIIALSNGEDVNILTANFVALSMFLCDVADTCPKASSHAFAALTQLIESTPSASSEECDSVLQRVVTQLHELIPQNVKCCEIPVEIVDRIIWICTIVENITFFVGDLIAPIEGPLMQMLLQLVESNDIDLVRESLPAMGAIACSIGPAFGKYTEQLLTFLPGLLSGERSTRSIRPAALLLGDMYTANVILPTEITNQYVGLLIQRVGSDDASPTTKSSLITVLGTIATAVGEDAFGWIDNLLPVIANELKSTIEQHEEESTDFESIIALHLAALSTYKSLIPILAASRDRKRVKSMFPIFEIIIRYTQTNEEILDASVELISLIAEHFGRQLHVILNSGTVIKLLEYAINEGAEEIQEKAKAVHDLISSC